MHLNKEFDQNDHDIYNTIGVTKCLRFFELLGEQAVQAPNIDKKAHYDILWGNKKVECEVRKSNYDTLYIGGYEDVRFPKRKFFSFCDTIHQIEDIPDIIITMDKDMSDWRFIIADEPTIRAGIPYMYKAYNTETKTREWFVPLVKEKCYRFRIKNNQIYDEKTVADGTNF